MLTTTLQRSKFLLRRQQVTTYLTPRRIRLYHSGQSLLFSVSHSHFDNTREDEQVARFIQPFSTPESIKRANVQELIDFVGSCFDKFDMTRTTALYPTLYQVLARCAEEGVPDALKMLGNMYAVGTLGVDKQIETSFKYYLEAAERGDAECQFYVARYYFNAYKLLLTEDIGEAMDDKKDLFEELTFDPKVIKNEDNFVYLDERSQRKLIVAEQKREKIDYSQYPGLSKRTISTKLKENQKLGLYYLNKSAENGFPKAQLLLSKIHMHGEEGDSNIKLAYELLLKAAEQDEPEAHYNLGVIYYNGLKGSVLKKDLPQGCLSPEEKQKYYESFEVEQDVDKAIQHFFKAAELQDPVATYWLGYSFIHGQHFEKDTQRGLKMVERACELGHPQALYYMYLLYTEGNESVPKDPKMADVMFKAALEANSADALFDLADRCFNGTFGEKRDLKRALQLYEQAGRLGHGDALFCLGTILYHGLGTEKDLKTSYERYSQAVSAGNKQALIPLARMTLKGEGVEKDEKYGNYLLSLAKESGVEYREEDVL